MGTDNKLEDHKDKKISPVAGNQNKNMIGIVIIVVITMILIFVSQSSKDKKTAEVSEKFEPANIRNTDYLDRIEKIEKAQKQKTRKQGLTDEQLAFMATVTEAEKRLKEQQAADQKELQIQRENAKRKSQMMVFSSTSGQTSSSDTPTNLSNISLLGLTPQANNKKPNQNQYSLPEPGLLDITQVSRIPNLSRTLTAGKFILGVLETAIDSTLPGQIRAVVATDVYSENGQNVLVEKGTRLIGNYQSGISEGQTRVFVIWSTAITPGGLQIPLASTGTDSLGVSGLSGEYDSHFFKRFGGALLLSVIENQSSGESQLNLSSQDSLSNASSIALNSSINIPPTIYVDQGAKINIFVARNILF